MEFAGWAPQVITIILSAQIATFAAAGFGGADRPHSNNRMAQSVRIVVKERAMNKDPKSTFEIPPEMRNLAEQSVEQAKKAVDGFILAAHQAVGALEEHAAAAQAGAKDVGRKAMTFAEQNVASSFDFAQRLVRAKDTQEVMRLQSEFIRSQLETLSQQARELGETATRAAADTSTPKG
jgi:phasin